MKSKRGAYLIIAPFLFLLSATSFLLVPKFESLSEAKFDERFQAVFVKETDFRIVFSGWIKSEDLPFLLRLQFPRSEMSTMVGFPDGASEIQLMSEQGVLIAVRLEVRRTDVCLVKVSGGDDSAVEFLISTLRREFPGLAIFKEPHKRTEQLDAGKPDPAAS